MEAIKDTVNSALEKLHIGGGAAQGTPAKEPSEAEFNELKAKYEKAGQAQVFVRTHGDVLEHLSGLCGHWMDCKAQPSAATLPTLLFCFFPQRY